MVELVRVVHLLVNLLLEAEVVADVARVLEDLCVTLALAIVPLVGVLAIGVHAVVLGVRESHIIN